MYFRDILEWEETGTIDDRKLFQLYRDKVRK